MEIKFRRQCQPCTACCDGWLDLVIDSVPVSPGHPCPHSTGSGCSNYENRPADPCKLFSCGWVIPESPLPEWMKPDTGKVIVIFNKKTWRGAPVDLAVPVGQKIPDPSLDWLKNYAETHRRPLLWLERVLKDGEYLDPPLFFGHGPQPFLLELLQAQQQGKAPW